MLSKILASMLARSPASGLGLLPMRLRIQRRLDRDSDDGGSPDYNRRCGEAFDKEGWSSKFDFDHKDLEAGKVRPLQVSKRCLTFHHYFRVNGAQTAQPTHFMYSITWLMTSSAPSFKLSQRCSHPPFSLFSPILSKWSSGSVDRTEQF